MEVGTKNSSSTYDSTCFQRLVGALAYVVTKCLELRFNDYLPKPLQVVHCRLDVALLWSG